MSALDKLTAKANTTVAKEDGKNKKKISNIEINKNVEVKEKNKLETKKHASEEKNISKISSTKTEKNKNMEKHPGGRKNTRGKNGTDYKMLNVAVPIDVYDKLKDASNGNMTFYVNQLLREKVN